MNDDLETLLPIRATGSRPPLYCVHPISGSAYAYTALGCLLASDQPVYGFESPGFEDGQMIFPSLISFAIDPGSNRQTRVSGGQYSCLVSGSLIA